MKVDQDKLRKHVTIKLSREDEDTDYRTSFDDPDTVDWIRAQLRSGNEWAWCCAHVTVSYRGFTGEEYLGGCSYESEANFKADGGYESMVDTAIEEIIQEIERFMDGPDIWLHTNPSCLVCASQP